MVLDLLPRRSFFAFETFLPSFTMRQEIDSMQYFIREDFGCTTIHSTVSIKDNQLQHGAVVSRAFPNLEVAWEFVPATARDEGVCCVATRTAGSTGCEPRHSSSRTLSCDRGERFCGHATFDGIELDDPVDAPGLLVRPARLEPFEVGTRP